MTAKITIKETAAEKKQKKIDLLKQQLIGLTNEHRKVDVSIARKLNTMVLTEIMKKKQELKAIATRINRTKGRLKKLGVIIED